MATDFGVDVFDGASLDWLGRIPEQRPSDTTRHRVSLWLSTDAHYLARGEGHALVVWDLATGARQQPPLRRDLERFLESSQQFVSGSVVVETSGGSIMPLSVESPHILRSKDSVYAQSANWDAREAEGFIKLLGQSGTLSATINPIYRL